MQRVDVYLSSTVLNSCVLRTRTVKNREFWVWTAVDFGVSVAVGVIAAAVVGMFVTATTPLWMAVAATAVVSIGIGYFLEGWFNFLRK
jgi:zinc transporter ZupT